MDHVLEIPLPSSRLSRLLGVALVLVGALAVLFVGVAAIMVRHSGAAARHPVAAQPALRLSGSQVGPTTPAGKPTLSRKQTTVLVLNGNGINGAAHSAAHAVRRAGYTVRSVGNARTMTYAHSLVMFRPGFRPEAVRFARDLGLKLVGPLDGLRIGAIHGAKLVYILGARP